jgi:hypothetical protein
LIQIQPGKPRKKTCNTHLLYQQADINCGQKEERSKPEHHKKEKRSSIPAKGPSHESISSLKSKSNQEKPREKTCNTHLLYQQADINCGQKEERSKPEKQNPSTGER